MVSSASGHIYLQRTVDDISDLFKPLEEAIRHDFLPALTGRTGINDLEINLLELPACLGGLGIVNPMKTAANNHSSSLRITAPLATLILQQEKEYPHNISKKQAAIKRTVKAEKRKSQSDEATIVFLPTCREPRTLAARKGRQVGC